jgi:hypothetical protein
MRGEESASSRPQGQEEDGAQYEEIPDELMLLAESELNQRIQLAQGEFRLKRKREYLAALSRGVQPSSNPFEFDDHATSPDPETPTRRRRHEDGAKLQLPLLKYSGGSYSDLQNFIFELENRFMRYPDNFHDDNDKVAYAVSSLAGTQKTRWRTYVMIHHPNDMASIMWSEMKKWLNDGLVDDATRSLEAVSKLRRLQQRDDQSFNQFLDQYELVENELPYDLPALFRVCSLLDALKPSLRTQIVSMGIPEGRQELLAAARRAEVLLRGGQPLSQQGRSHATGPRGPTTPAPAPPVSSSPERPAPSLVTPPGPYPRPAATGSTPRGSCYRCGDPSHYANVCPQVRCGRCGRMGHSDSRCPEPVSAANATPIARHAAPDP